MTTLWTRAIRRTAFSAAVFGAALVASAGLPALAGPAAGAGSGATGGPAVILPLDRTAYFVGEKVPLAVSVGPGNAAVRLDAVNADGRTLLYEGKPGPLWLDTARLAPGDYALELNGAPGVPRFTITGTVRRSVASMQDETPPPNEHAPSNSPHWEGVVQTLRESGVDMLVHMGAVDVRRLGYLDALARAGAMALANPDTRPTSFCPTRNAPEELDAMSQRLVLGAQANGRYPNFGGFCYGWDTTGYAVGGRKMLMTYWGWGELERSLRNYIERIDRQMIDAFRARTGFEPVSEADYIGYLLSIQRPEFATMIDLPTRAWLREIARHTKPMAETERAVFEKRLDAWSSYLMGMYGEVYAAFSAAVRGLSPSFRHTASVQVDHGAVRNGQYFPAAYAPLDFRYQSTWNDQVGGPDYAYQWLLTAGLLDMHREGKPTWISNAIAAAHGRASTPGKLTRVAAHGLAWGMSGIGFALEGFSNLLGGMNRDTNWPAIRDTSGGADVRAGRDFLDRFAGLALNGRGDHGVGILFSKSQLARQHVTMGFGQPHCQMFVALTRLGYTPRFVTEEELAAGAAGGLKALVVIGQTFPVGAEALAGLRRFVEAGGRLFADARTTVEMPGARRLEADLPFSQPGKPHSWSAPNMTAGDNDSLQFARWYAAHAPGIAAALGATGHALLAPASGAASPVTLIQLDGGKDARYVVAVNDSFVATQADWYQVSETLLSTAAGAWYDLIAERSLGEVSDVECDLTETPARVFGLLARPAASLEVRARQDLKGGDDLVVSARVLDAAQKPLEAVIPLHLSLIRPDGKVHGELFRATERDGLCVLSVPVPSNVPAGTWQLAVRSQLDGTTVRLPVTIDAREAVCARACPERVLVRGRPAVEALLQRGQKVVVPIFDSPQAPAQRAAAERLKAALGPRGVEVEIREKPSVGDYVLTYDPDDAVKTANAKADRGEAFGAIRRKTTNQNDWFCVLSGWRFGRPVVLLDLVNAKNDNPPAESLDAEGLLWPRVSAGFPGPGRAVIHGVPWAFAPRVNAVVIQAADDAGLLAGAEAFAQLPDDLLSPSVEAARATLWRERRVGAPGVRPATEGLTAEGGKTAHEPKPFRIEFPSGKPPTAEQARALAPRKPEPPVLAIPSSVDPHKQVTPYYYDDSGRLIETATAGFLVPDMRFHDALRVVADVPQAGRTNFILAGLFRTSDRQPKSQAQWEDVLRLYEQVVPKQRRPIEVDVRVGGRSVGTLTATRMERRKVPLESGPSHGTKDVRTADEDVAVEIAGEVDLPAGRQEIFLIHRNIVDGLIEGIGIGMPPAPKPEEKK